MSNSYDTETIELVAGSRTQIIVAEQEEEETKSTIQPVNGSEQQIEEKREKEDDMKCYCGDKFKKRETHATDEKCDECGSTVKKDEVAYICNNRAHHCGRKYLCVNCVSNHHPKTIEIFGNVAYKELQRNGLKDEKQTDEWDDIRCDGYRDGNQCRQLIQGEDVVYSTMVKNFCEECANHPDDIVVCKLHEDIWSMAFVLVRSGTGLSFLFWTLLISIYFIQLFSLIIFVWGANLELDRDVIVPYTIQECSVSYNGPMVGNDSDIFDFCGELRLLNFSYNIGLIESNAKYQKYNDLQYKPEWGRMHVWGWSSVFSMALLSIYILSSLSNSIEMITIALRYGKKNFQSVSCCSELCIVISKCCITINDTGQNFDIEREIRKIRTDCALVQYVLCCCNKYSNPVSNLLNVMAFANILLTVFAYFIGMWFVIFYGLYYGIQSPTEIILTPIGIVFILEIDDWTFNLVKNYYPECNNDELWQFKVSNFPYFDFQKTYMKISSTIWFILTFVSLVFILFFSGLANGIRMSNDITDDVRNAKWWQQYSILVIFVLLLFSLITNHLQIFSKIFGEPIVMMGREMNENE